MPQGWKQLLAVGACWVLGGEAIRHTKKQSHTTSSTKIIADVPVLNYDQAYGGKASMAQSAAVEDWVIVTHGGVSNDKLRHLCQMAGECLKTGHPSEGGMPYFEIRGTENELEIVLQASKGLVKFAEPDGWFRMAPEIAADETSRTSETWGLNRVGAGSRENEGQNTHIFVLDTGIRSTHRDFGGRVIPAFDATTSVGACNGRLNCAIDREGHGTHCAGTAAGRKYGVAPKSIIHAVSVLDSNGEGEWSWSYAGLDYVAQSNIRPAVVSMSLGAGGIRAAFKTAVDAAVNAGCVVVAAAGNDATDACSFSPAYIPSAITVGGTAPGDRRYRLSNTGACVDLWAPGVNVRSASHTSDTGSTLKSGTSMACPHVSGAVAIILSKTPTKTSSVVLQEMLDNSIRNAITGLTPDDTNALLYVGAGGPPPTPAPVPTPVPTPAPTPVPTPQQFCPEYSSGPDPVYGDCMCDQGYVCWWGDDVIGWGIGCPYSITPTSGHYSRIYFNPECAEKGECGCW